MLVNLMKRAFGASTREVTEHGNLFDGLQQIFVTIQGVVNPAIQAITYQGRKVGAQFKALTNGAAEIAYGCLMGEGIPLIKFIYSDKSASHPAFVAFRDVFGKGPTPKPA